MKQKGITYYEWDDIEKNICEKMGIDPCYFRDYHKVVGGEYLDLWLVWFRAVCEEVHNGAIVPVHLCYFDDVGNLKEEYGDRIEPFIQAVKELFEEVVTIDNMVYIEYDW